MSIHKLGSALLGALLAVAPVIAAHAETATPQSVGLSSERICWSMTFVARPTASYCSISARGMYVDGHIRHDATPSCADSRPIANAITTANATPTPATTLRIRSP